MVVMVLEMGRKDAARAELPMPTLCLRGRGDREPQHDLRPLVDGMALQGKSWDPGRAGPPPQAQINRSTDQQIFRLSLGDTLD
jgi:hypothetical protein